MATDPVLLVLEPEIKKHITRWERPTGDGASITKLFQQYTDELRYICNTHTLSDEPGLRLLETEVVIGTILAKCVQKRWRKDRIYRMKRHTQAVVQEVQRQLCPTREVNDIPVLRQSLDRALNAWCFSIVHHQEFGANSFGLIGLGIVFDCLDKLNGLSPSV